MIYTGNFETPVMGESHVPLPISGEGTVESSESGLAFDGFEPGRGASSTLLSGLVIVMLIGLPILLVSLGVEIDGETLGYAVFSPILLFLMRNKKSTSERPLQFEVPWSRIDSMNINKKSRRLEILVKGQTPKGLIHFRPEDDMESVYDQLEGSRRRFGGGGACKKTV